MSKAKRRRQANLRRNFVRTFAGPICGNCGQHQEYGHYIPPSMGEIGFWSCAPIKGGMPDTTLTSARMIDGQIEIEMQTQNPRLIGLTSVEFMPTGTDRWQPVVGITGIVPLVELP